MLRSAVMRKVSAHLNNVLELKRNKNEVGERGGQGCHWPNSTIVSAAGAYFPPALVACTTASFTFHLVCACYVRTPSSIVRTWNCTLQLSAQMGSQSAASRGLYCGAPFPILRARIGEGKGKGKGELAHFGQLSR